MKLLGTMENVNGELFIGGVGMNELKAAYGTPLYVYDQTALESQLSLFKTSFVHPHLLTHVAYASKAFLSLAMAQLVNDFGLSLDVASGGEMMVAYKAGFDMSRVIFHGNNKLDDELDLAISLGCGTVVIDNRYEMARLKTKLSALGVAMDVYLRINPGIDASTHEYIKTSNHDSKFGESIYDAEIMNIVSELSTSSCFNFLGFHCHIGSQIFDENSFIKAADVVLSFYKKVENELGLVLPAINLGGGFGVYYTDADTPFDLAPFLSLYLSTLYSRILELGLSITTVTIEPGRSIVCNAGSTLYTVGDLKETYGKKDYIFIDGGMSDNPRPALYQAKYEACLTSKLDESVSHTYTIAGKLCESGDVLIRDFKLPSASVGDLLLVSSTGAYTHSMSSNYNKLLRPAVVFVKSGTHKLVVRRQTYDDLILQDIL